MLLIEIDSSNALDYKKIRLRALADSPDAFASTYEEEAALSAKEWRQRALELAKPRSIGVLMVNANGPCGLVQATPERGGEEREHVAWLGSLFIEQTLRRQGWGGQLMEYIARWALDNNYARLHLEVANNNRAALSFYLSAGFVLAGNSRPHPRLPNVKEIELCRRLR